MSIIVIASERLTWERELSYARQGRSPWSPAHCLRELARIDAQAAIDADDETFIASVMAEMEAA